MYRLPHAPTHPPKPNHTNQPNQKKKEEEETSSPAPLLLGVGESPVPPSAATLLINYIPYIFVSSLLPPSLLVPPSPPTLRPLSLPLSLPCVQRKRSEGAGGGGGGSGGLAAAAPKGVVFERERKNTSADDLPKPTIQGFCRHAKRKKTKKEKERKKEKTKKKRKKNNNNKCYNTFQNNTKTKE